MFSARQIGTEKATAKNSKGAFCAETMFVICKSTANVNFYATHKKKGDRRQINTKIWKFRRAFANMAALDAFSKSLGSCFVIDEDILLMSIFTAIVQLNRHNTCNSLKPGENYVKCRRINYSAPTGKKGRKIYVCLS